MKKINNILALLVMALVGLSLTACSEDDLDTNQFRGDVSLNAFGPNPVMRGGTLRFVGSNLDQVASINIPGVGAVTNIAVIRAGVPSEIRVGIPKDGPTVGRVTLNTRTGLAIPTLTDLTYIEGVEVTGFTPAEADPGTIIKIEGEYLNLVYSIGFADNVVVSSSDFKSWDRYAIEVAVPEAAKTGKIELYTADLTVQGDDELDYQTIVTDDALIVGLPTTSKIASPRGTAGDDMTVTAKAGETITLTGKFYNVVDAIKFGSFKTEEFTASEDGTTLSFVLPAEAPSGAINLVCKSGVETPAGILKAVVPSNLAAAPAPVKAGQPLTVTGQDMDLVASVLFAGKEGSVAGGDITVEAGKVVVAAVPETAIDGQLLLILASGETVAADYTLVKPAVTAYNANPVSAGAPLQITGTDLDLVKSISFGSGVATLEEGAVSADGTTITVTVPMDGQSGEPELQLANGTSVKAPALAIDEAVFCYITELPTDDNKPSAGDMLMVPVKNGDKLTNVFINGNEVHFIYNEKTAMLAISIPSNAKATSELKLVSSNGEIAYEIPVLPNTEIYTTIWTGSWACASWAGNQDLAWGGYDWSTVTAGTMLEIHLARTVQGQWGCISLRHGNSWGPLPEPIPGQYDLNEDGDIVLTIELTQAVINDLVDNGGLVVTGDNYTLTKVVLHEHIDLETAIWTGPWTCSGWSGNQDLAWGGFDWTTIKANSTMRFYYQKIDASAWGCLSLRHGNSWGALPEPIPGQYDFTEAEGCIEVVFTANVLADIIDNGGLVMTGDNFILTKVTYE